MPFKKGTSGNPRGRPKGGRNMATIRADELFEPSRQRHPGTVRMVAQKGSLI
jgi:Family of unknown function (DUF5681)